MNVGSCIDRIVESELGRELNVGNCIDMIVEAELGRELNVGNCIDAIVESEIGGGRWSRMERGMMRGSDPSSDGNVRAVQRAGNVYSRILCSILFDKFSKLNIFRFNF